VFLYHLYFVSVLINFLFPWHRAANYCRTSDNVRLNLANVRAKVILIGHWSDHKKKLSHYTFFCCDKIRLQIHSIHWHSSILLNVAPEWLYILVLWLIYILWRIYVRPNLVVLVFVRPKLKVIGQMSCQVKYLIAALLTVSRIHNKPCDMINTRTQGVQKRSSPTLPL
jgi:hypothetical protein